LLWIGFVCHMSFCDAIDQLLELVGHDEIMLVEVEECCWELIENEKRKVLYVRKVKELYVRKMIELEPISKILIFEGSNKVPTYKFREFTRI
jgi:hypothetical protein